MNLADKLKIYPIIDLNLLKSLSLDLKDTAQSILKGGAKAIQLRAKDIGDDDFLKAAQIVAKVTKDFDALLIINDRVDVALLSGADGVHLGTDDMPIEKAREILGSDKIIGLSTHDFTEIKEAHKRGADYIGFGPVFITTTKKDIKERTVYDILEKAAALAASLNLPFTAIAGIKEYHIEDLTSKGVKSVAVISDILKADNIEEKVETLLEKINTSS